MNEDPKRSAKNRDLGSLKILADGDVEPRASKFSSGESSDYSLHVNPWAFFSNDDLVSDFHSVSFRSC